jgi:hypothetical protein
LPQTTGWGTTFGGTPARLWLPGSLQGILVPYGLFGPGFVEAQWQVDGGVWHTNGAVVSGLSLTNHTVTFSNVSGWATPAPQTVSVSSNSFATAIGIYNRLYFEFEYGNFSGTIAITGYNGPGGTVTIPGTINGLLVTSIGPNAFQNINYLYSVTMPNSVTDIGAGAFQNCSGLTNVTVLPQLKMDFSAIWVST